MRRIPDLIRDYFGFSATEMRGFWVLFSLALLLLTTLPWLEHQFYRSYAYQASVEDRQLLDSLVALLEESKEPAYTSPSETKEAIHYTFFDPNTAPVETLLQNGLPRWLADRIIRYREKGGTYHSKKDLLKIYGFTEAIYQSVAPYVRLPERIKSTPSEYTRYHDPATTVPRRTDKTVEKVINRFDINVADSTRLREIPGIGPVFSARIVRFRDKLGGIHDTSQFSEVYHLSPEAIENLREYTYISENFQVQKVNINTDDVSTLAKHPYISFPLAKAIVRHRKDYGNFKRLVDCKEVYLMDEATFQKIAPYLSL